MKVQVKQYQKPTYTMGEDGKFSCTHDNSMVGWDINEQGYKYYYLSCSDCNNEDLTDFQAVELIDAHLGVKYED